MSGETRFLPKISTPKKDASSAKAVKLSYANKGPWMGPEAAKAYGIVSKIVNRADEV